MRHGVLPNPLSFRHASEANEDEPAFLPETTPRNQRDTLPSLLFCLSLAEKAGAPSIAFSAKGRKPQLSTRELFTLRFFHSLPMFIQP
jgi:hypothetical protein